MDYVYWSSAEYPFDFLHAAIVNAFDDDSPEKKLQDDDAIADAQATVSAQEELNVFKPSATTKVEHMGYRVGYALVTRLCKDFPRISTDLESMKFICKELWAAIFGKQVDNLRTNHHDMFVILDNQFRLLSPMSNTTQYVDVAPKYLTFTCGLLRGALANLGVSATVVAETQTMPAAKFSIQIIK